MSNPPRAVRPRQRGVTAAPAPVARRGVEATVSFSRERRHRGQVEGREGETRTYLRNEIPDIHAKVQVEGSSTINMDNFNSVRVGVSVQLPCAPDPDSLEATYLQASDYVERWLQREIDAATQ